jgi:hypothetical protein
LVWTGDPATRVTRRRLSPLPYLHPCLPLCQPPPLLPRRNAAS